jgi:hypothetical protein
MISNCGIPKKDALNGLFKTLIKSPSSNLEDVIIDQWRQYNEYSLSEIENLAAELIQKGSKTLFALSKRFEPKHYKKLKEAFE